MNKYASNVRTYIARNCAEVVINPPAALTFAGTEWKQQLFRTYQVTPTGNFGINGNLFLKQVGLFCQYGNSMILNTPSNRFDISIKAMGICPVAGVGTSTFTANSKAVAGVGFLADFAGFLASGDAMIADNNNNCYIIDAIADDNNMTLTDYARSTDVCNPTNALRPGTSLRYRMADWSLLNVMQDNEFFMPVASFAAPSIFGVNDRILISVTVRNSLPNTVNPSFLTNNVNVAYLGKTAVFDVYMQVEFTPQ